MNVCFCSVTVPCKSSIKCPLQPPETQLADQSLEPHKNLHPPQRLVVLTTCLSNVDYQCFKEREVSIESISSALKCLLSLSLSRVSTITRWLFGGREGAREPTQLSAALTSQDSEQTAS